jgi:8-hydroxy-5-deazaflavin:NADPH oxidoreductase
LRDFVSEQAPRTSPFVGNNGRQARNDLRAGGTRGGLQLRAQREEAQDSGTQRQGQRDAWHTPEAALEADAVLLAVHWSRIQDVLKQAGDFSGKMVVTCSLPMNEHNTDLVIGHTTSGAEELQKKIPKAHVVAAFNTVPSEVLFGVYEAKRKASRPSLVYCGDDRSAKDLAAALIRDAGFDPIDAGPLRIARYIEPFALLSGQLAYEGEGGAELAYRFQRFGK